MGMGLVIDTNENRSRKCMSFLKFLQIADDWLMITDWCKGNLLTQLRVAGIICVGEKKRWVSVYQEKEVLLNNGLLMGQFVCITLIHFEEWCKLQRQLFCDLLDGFLSESDGFFRNALLSKFFAKADEAFAFWCIMHWNKRNKYNNQNIYNYVWRT